MPDGSKSPGEDWIAIVRKNGSPEFAAAFAKRPVLDASVLRGPCTGAESIAAFFGAASGIYDSIAFTNETVNGGKTYLEWEGKSQGLDVSGATILTRDAAGLIQRIQLHHSPLHVLVRFSTDSGRRLRARSPLRSSELPHEQAHQRRAATGSNAKITPRKSTNTDTAARQVSNDRTLTHA